MVPAEAPRKALSPIAGVEGDLAAYKDAEAHFNGMIDLGIAQAKALLRLIEEGPKDRNGNSQLAPVIDGKVFARAEIWTTVARFNDREPVILDVQAEPGEDGQIYRYTVRAGLKDRRTGEVINEAVMCADRGEFTWGKPKCPQCGASLFWSKSDKEWFCWKKKGGCGFTSPPNDSLQRTKAYVHDDMSDAQLLSKAETRAISKVCRLVFSWVIVLGKMEPTPYEEMEASEIASQMQSRGDAGSGGGGGAAPGSSRTHDGASPRPRQEPRVRHDVQPEPQDATVVEEYTQEQRQRFVDLHDSGVIRVAQDGRGGLVCTIPKQAGEAIGIQPTPGKDTVSVDFNDTIRYNRGQAQKIINAIDAHISSKQDKPPSDTPF